MNHLDITSSILGIITTYLCTRNFTIHWPLAILCSLIDCIIYQEFHFSNNLMCKVIEISISCYGWYYWLQHTNKNSMIKHLNIQQKYKLSLIIIFLITSIVTLNPWDHTTLNDNLLDTTTSILIIVGLMLESRRIMSCWHIWGLLDILQIIIFLEHGYYINSLKAGAYLCMAFSGYSNWRKLAQQQKKQQPNPIIPITS